MARPHAALRKATTDEQKQMASLKANDGALARAVARRGERRIHATSLQIVSTIRQIRSQQHRHTHILVRRFGAVNLPFCKVTFLPLRTHFQKPSATLVPRPWKVGQHCAYLLHDPSRTTAWCEKNAEMRRWESRKLNRQLSVSQLQGTSSFFVLPSPLFFIMISTTRKVSTFL